MRWMGLSSTEEDSRVYHNARVFVALRKSLAKLIDFYQNLEHVPPLAPNQPHPRFFPYPNSFVAEGGSVARFRFLQSLEEDAACVTYLAEILEASGESQKVVVKFVTRYGQEVHQFLARRGHAPTLRYFGPLRETKDLGISSPSVPDIVPGLCLGSDPLMRMVVMDYVRPQPRIPSDARGQIEAILTQLHCEGYVFGDLREQNILFDAKGKVKLIDFNWCGRYKTNIADKNLPTGLQKKIEDNISGIQPAAGPYSHYPLSMSETKDMWAPGMEPLAEIRPKHDWLMLHKLSYL